ncbi:hypothetical protein ACV8SN_20215 [Citrobacter portucalensis]|uniref:hypothetical protein n=1 Tax=Citrobacter portucalensis TaxID=1639133 RepID=UPI00398C5BF7
MIFNGEMVRAILDGRKTQTRRIVKVKLEPSKSRPGDFWFPSKKLECMVHISDLVSGNSPIADCHLFFQEHCCPFGAVGDRIWVRETFGDCGERLVYRADSGDGAQCKVRRWTPSIHMPRWASRLTLEITGVRVERLRGLSEDDAKSEGITPPSGGVLPGWEYRINFRDLWMSIYGSDNWEANPWVWVIEFKVVPNVQDNTA